jgi:amino acid transporter
MLLVFAIVALVKVGTGDAPAGSIGVSWSWFNPFDIDSFSTFFRGLLLMIFIYWGWDSAVAVNEETEDPTRTPGRAAVISTVLLVVTYTIVTLSAQSFAGIGEEGIGLGNQDNSGDVLSVLGKAVFGGSGLGSFLSHLLILMVLTSAAASTRRRSCRRLAPPCRWPSIEHCHSRSRECTRATSRRASPHSCSAASPLSCTQA